MISLFYFFSISLSIMILISFLLFFFFFWLFLFYVLQAGRGARIHHDGGVAGPVRPR